ncbi:VOC family protein [Massilia sp. TS11]|uniref:VOC family protein n=1 Tax=Massilia sp. TS11 TaxID=2908003 RepID=UPI001ED9CEE4|nr:VOC family protein [Massilia sp. TS11]MCG2586058.1 VOC family protein [Massilia sp. TS11]
MPHASIIPCLRYRDAPGAIDWLCHTFGFTAHLVVPGHGGQIDHAQLTLGNGMVMLSSSGRDTVYGRLMRLPEEIGGYQTQTIYLVVPDADAIFVRAKAAGAAIVIPIQDEDYGGRGFTCKDLEGHIWSFGTYDPWAE